MNNWKRLSYLACVSALACLSSAAIAHELEENRATLVMRDPTHIAVTIHIAYTGALHQALAPQLSATEFLLVYSALKLEEFQAELARAQDLFRQRTRVYLPAGAQPPELELTHWVWPDAKQVQAILQQRVMQSLVDPGGHFHEPPLEIRADMHAPRGFGPLQIRFPPEFRRVLVVAYRPSQVWAEPNAVSPPIKF